MIKKIIVAISLLLAATAPAAAQFADQATFAGTGAGTANAQTITLPNVTSYADVRGVIIKYIPAATNTGSATLNINGFVSSPSFLKPNGSGVAAFTGGEVVSGQPTYVMYDGTFFNLVSPTSLPIGAASLQNSTVSFGTPTNLQLNATVGSNELRIAVKGNDGNDPSATNRVIIPFRNVTIANGSPSIVSLQSPLSFTIASGATMGCTSGVPCRLWVVAFNNSGSVALCAFNAWNGTSVAMIDESSPQNSGASSTGGSSSQTFWCSAGSIANVPVRILGYLDITETTAGVWATGPTKVQLFGPGINRPGTIVTSKMATTNTPLANSTVTPVASNVSISYTPKSATNPIAIHLDAYVNTGGPSANLICGVVYANGTSTSDQQCSGSASTVGQFYGLFGWNLMRYYATVAPITINLRFFTNVAGQNTSVNNGTIIVYEIMG